MVVVSIRKLWLNMIPLFVIRTCGKKFGLLVILLTALYITSLNLVALYGKNIQQELADINDITVKPKSILVQIHAANTLTTPSMGARTFKSVKISQICPVTRSGYCVLSNFILAKKSVGYNDSITLTTQSTLEFLQHIAEVCQRWQGPISLTVYAPGSDFNSSMRQLGYLINCMDKCVSDWVTWHFIFDVQHQPKLTNFVLGTECNIPTFNSSYVSQHNLAYPINVARNVARLNAYTKYIFTSDIELYPSANVISRFLKTMDNIQDNKSSKDVYVLPVFEVSSLVKTTPLLKQELLDLYKLKKAVSFHRFTCDVCHKIPNLNKWLLEREPDDLLKIFETTKRDKLHQLSDWEPFFISTNDFPYFDEQLTWNGKNNKMQVALEMCYLNYDFHILNNAFLVHTPGIKIYNAKNERSRSRFMVKNAKRFREIREQLGKKYNQMEFC